MVKDSTMTLKQKKKMLGGNGLSAGKNKEMFVVDGILNQISGPLSKREKVINLSLSQEQTMLLRTILLEERRRIQS